MNGIALARAAKERIADVLTTRTIYRGAVPEGALPTRYVVLWASEGSEESARSTFTVHVQTPALWVTCVSRHPDPTVAADEAQWDARKVREALRNWRPESRWAVQHSSSQPAQPDSAAVGSYRATEQFSLRSSI